jgi:hypothetical protein
MIWVFFAYRSKEYLKFLMTFASIRSVHWGIIIGRIILIATALLIMVFMIWLQYLFNGINITGDISSLLVSFSVTLMALSFFMIVSAGLGAVKNVKSTVYRGVTAALIWLFFVLLCPEVLNLVFSRIAEGSMKSFYNHENKKIKKLMEFEKDAYEKVKTGRYETNEEKFEVDKKSGEIWWEEFKREIEPLENEMIKQSDKIARNFQFWCSLTPVTFCKSVNNETSSKGLNSSSKFHKDNLEKQRGFLRYYLDKRFYENYSQYESYLTKDEIIIIAKSSLPDYFAVGLIWNFFLIIVASCFGYFRFKRWMLKAEGESKIGEFKFNIKKGKNNYLLTADEGLRTQLFNYFSYLGKSSLIIQIDGKPQQKGENEFIYLCSPSSLPFGVSEKSLYKMLYKKKCTEDLKIWEVMFRYAVESKRLIILDNFFKGLKENEVEEILRVIRGGDIISLYIGDNYYEAQKPADAPIIYSLDDTSIDGIREIAEVVKKKNDFPRDGNGCKSGPGNSLNH